MWSQQAITDGSNFLQKDFGDIVGLANKTFVTAIGGGKFSASGFIVNCPVISRVN
jgi:hypothetical protein